MDYVKISLIHIADRQRKDYGDLSDMKESIQRHGIIQPVVITQRHEGGYWLVAGGRRLATATALGHDAVPVRTYDSLSTFEQREIELEENIKRKDLTWQEECRAVCDYHNLRVAADSEWTAERTATALNMAASGISHRLTIMREAVDNPAVLEASGLSAAYGVTRRKLERAVDAELNQLLAIEEGHGQKPEDSDAGLAGDSPSGDRAVRTLIAQQPKVKVWNKDLLEVLPTWDGQKFNLIHCDFPYGLKMDSSALQGTRSELARYADSPDVYWSLTQTLLLNLDRIAYPSCHIVFWFSMNYYTPTVELLTQYGLSVNPFPLIWDKADGKGILPDPERGPRRTYETALLASRGDRKIVRAVKNSISLPTEKAQAEHLSEKPIAMLKHFLSMLVDETTELLDPTCGSGTSLVAASELGAKKCLGIELDPNHVETARRRVQKSDLLGGLAA